MSESIETLGGRVLHLRKQKTREDGRAWSQEDLAQKSGVDRADISRIERNKRPARIQEILEIAEALGVTADKLVEGIELPERTQRDLDRLGSLFERLTCVEAERDTARAESAQLKQELQAMQDRAERDRNSFAEQQALQGRELNRALEERDAESLKVNHNYKVWHAEKTRADELAKRLDSTPGWGMAALTLLAGAGIAVSATSSKG